MSSHIYNGMHISIIKYLFDSYHIKLQYLKCMLIFDQGKSNVTIYVVFFLFWGEGGGVPKIALSKLNIGILF